MFTTGQRSDLHALLVQVLGSPHVYFQAPANMQMQYPCIVYDVDDARTEFAGNKPYIYTKRYQVTLIDSDADSLVADTIPWLEQTVFDRKYIANNLHHFVFIMYF